VVAPQQFLTHGRPTSPDTEKVLSLFAPFSESTLVEHAKIEQALKEVRTSNRYRSIIVSVRKRCAREHNIELQAVPGVGYRIPFGPEQIRLGTKKTRRGVRQIASGTRVVAMVSDDRLPNEQDRKTRDYIHARMNVLTELARTERRAIEATLGKTAAAPRLNGK